MKTAPAQQEFENLLQAHKGLIIKIARMYGKTAEDQKDLFQEIVIQLWRGYSSFRGQSKLSTWIYRVGFNVAITQIRKEKRQPLAVSLDSLGDDLDREDPDVNGKDNLQVLYQAISRLNEIEKAIVMLYLDEKSYEEMEIVLGISNANLRVKMSRIKEKLHQIAKNEQSWN